MSGPPQPSYSDDEDDYEDDEEEVTSTASTSNRFVLLKILYKIWNTPKKKNSYLRKKCLCCGLGLGGAINCEKESLG